MPPMGVTGSKRAPGGTAPKIFLVCGRNIPTCTWWKPNGRRRVEWILEDWIIWAYKHAAGRPANKSATNKYMSIFKYKKDHHPFLGPAMPGDAASGSRSGLPKGISDLGP